MTYLKRQMISSACTAPDYVKLNLSTCLLERKYKDSTSTERLRHIKRALEESENGGDGNQGGSNRATTKTPGGTQSTLDT